ncbi:YibE/F family protein [Collinsella sp. AGMB00827]|uniref:YibE/F family protein n=1 Tax=Collinsella ureilytica TaxID=2869515 RepID=A0ABS7MK46_9ACTN|nr:YibE/F family protein [Collinsella urealyticum]
MKDRLISHRRDLLTVLLMLAVIAGSLWFASTRDTSFTMLTANGITYPEATIVRVQEEHLDREEGTNRFLGHQVLEVRLETGMGAGETVLAENSLSADHNVLGRVGERVIIKAERQEGIAPYYSVFNYDRMGKSALVFGLFALCMVVVGGLKGLRSMIGLAFAMLMIILLLVPAVFSGIPAVPAGLAVMIIITIFSMLLLNGWSPKTYAAIGSTVLGMAVAAGVYVLFSSILVVSGFNKGDAEELILIAQTTGLDVQATLFVGVLVASLGAVMDMCMSIATALFELKDQHPTLSRTQMVTSAFNMGRDMIGTMCQTLILAFTGSSLTSMLVLMAYGVDMAQLISSDYMAVELLHSFVGGIAVIACVPVTAFVCAAVTKEPASS